jgi:hypothetical protein
MNNEKIKTLLLAFLISAVAYAGNKCVFLLPDLKGSYAGFHYSLEALYGMFFLFTIIILILLLVVKKRSLDYVGMSFLLITSVKMGIAFFIARPILIGVNHNLVEKINFFVIFILFLAIETIITIRLLNKGSESNKQNINSIKK